MLPSSRVGFSSTPGQTRWVRYERMGFAVRICNSLSVSVLDVSSSFACEEVEVVVVSGAGAGAQHSSVSVSK